ncbi:helix-turn-helix domain-containing protein [Thermomonospora amylolytica]|uniref:helix-turn-helix domain-containing protein n=1 Tax=Thermomonospora amylolytica TaxID=1411117 RepID=UPI001F2E7A9B|nr:helix-turn-helix domain-containing protein [Thermomonospora amylolytica]
MAANSYLVETTTTGGVRPRERREFWSEHVTSYHCELDYRYRQSTDFTGGTIRQCSDTYQIVQFWSDEITYARTPGLVRRHPDEDYRFLLPLKGGLVVRQDGNQAELLPGAGSLITLDAPFELLHGSDTRAFIMTIPADEVNGPLNRTSSLAAGLDMSKGLGRVAADMMRGLFEERDTLSAPQFDAVCARLVELLCMLVVGDDRPDVPGHLAEVEAMVRRYVRRHAADPELNGASMARELGWSLRQVQLALHHAGTTPRELIREERLRLVRERLLHPGYRHMTITELAYASGFSSASALSTAFRRRFGMSPREFRREAAGEPAERRRALTG